MYITSQEAIAMKSRLTVRESHSVLLMIVPLEYEKIKAAF